MYWWDVTQTDDPERIRKVIALAEDELPIAEVATGTANEMGFGEQYWVHSALDFIVQELARFPGEGWSIMQASLSSPVIRNRNMVLRTLNDWPVSAWPSNAKNVLVKATEVEPDDEVRERMKKLIAGENINEEIG